MPRGAELTSQDDQFCCTQEWLWDQALPGQFINNGPSYREIVTAKELPGMLWGTSTELHVAKASNWAWHSLSFNWDVTAQKRGSMSSLPFSKVSTQWFEQLWPHLRKRKCTSLTPSSVQHGHGAHEYALSLWVKTACLG